MKKILFCVILIILIGSIIPVNAIQLKNRNIVSSDNILINDDVFFDNFIQKIMNHSHFPSISVCVIKNNQVIWSNGYGFSNIEQNYQATDKTIYGICSITKTIVGVALMQLYDKGLFELDDDVNEYLPFNIRNPNFPEENITFRMLLSHSSSLRDTNSYWNINFYYEGGPPFEGYPSPWIENYLLPNGSNYDPNIWDANDKPGEIGFYANINFDIVGYLVEIISNETLYDYCKDHIFLPLEMYNTSFNLSDYNEKDIATPYNWDPDLKNYVRNFNQVHLHYPAGGVFSSVADMSHFMIAQMNGGKYKEVQILNESTIEEMHKIQTPNNKYARSYGLAWLFESRSINLGIKNFYLPFFKYEGHGGAVTFGLRNEMNIRIKKDTSIIFFINSDSFMYREGHNGVQLLREIFYLKA